MSKSIKEVLLEHEISEYWNVYADEPRWACLHEGCSFETDNWHGAADKAIAGHHEDMLMEAGYCLPKDAWEQGVVFGHNSEGRLIDKRGENPYV